MRDTPVVGSDADVVRRRVVVDGRVQGVFFRDTCRRVAGRHGVRGWVANRHDGRVEAVFEGSRDAVGRMLLWCRQGPSSAVVTAVDVVDEEPLGEAGFRIVSSPD